jgi:hypothetical protein
MDPAWDGEGWVPLEPEDPLEPVELDPEDPLEADLLGGEEPLWSFDPCEEELDPLVVLEAFEELFVQVAELSLEEEPDLLALLAILISLWPPTPCPFSVVTEGDA